MANVSEVLADVHEGGSGVPDRLARLGMQVTVRHLPIGDYAVAKDVLVERKSIADFHESVLQGRFWRQIGSLRRASARPFLLLEGADVDRGPLAPNAVRGIVLAVLEQGVAVLRSSGVDDSALWLVRLAARERVVRPRPRPVYDQTPAARGEVAEAVLAAIPGISVTLARRLLRQFGTVASVVAADPDALATVTGIGPARAEALRRALTSRL
jgi:ERCC4-type nuclease